ncbi:MAG: flagellar hook-associated protein FlgK [candidate division Zixibacteria bacterium]|nr:flagellar hook-associated protein FlgK [candidate division Zixibacteria bacterium]
MPGLFQGLEIGKRALLSHQLVLQTIGQNIANVNTPGYTRQRVNIQATNPEEVTYGSVGTGITVTDIRHIRDLFLGQQEQEATKSLGQWSYKDKTLSEIEALYNEPQDNSLSHLLSAFWDSWSQLATNSDSISNRKAVVATAGQLIAGFQQLSRKLMDLREATDRDVTNMVADINQKTADIARINQQIAGAELGGHRANDLRDARDLITRELSSLVDVRTIEKPNGETIVHMGAMALVDGSQSFPIASETANKNGVSTSRIVWKGTSVQLTNLSGQLAGVMETRDVLVQDNLDGLDELAQTIIEQVNAIHVTGYGMNGTTGVAFFDPNFSSASTMRLSQDVANDQGKVAAASVITGDNHIALALSELRDAKVMNENVSSMNDFYSSLVGLAGMKAKEASTTSQNFELLVQQISNARQSVEGVNLDEEMANLVRSQHAYDASARVITAMDQALDTVISGMGVVGR